MKKELTLPEEVELINGRLAFLKLFMHTGPDVLHKNMLSQKYCHFVMERVAFPLSLFNSFFFFFVPLHHFHLFLSNTWM